MAKPKRVAGTASTKNVNFKVTPEEVERFHQLAWFRRSELSVLIRNLLEDDYRAAEREGLKAHIAYFRRTMPGAALVPARKKSKAR